jgi:hypothetical protein
LGLVALKLFGAFRIQSVIVGWSHQHRLQLVHHGGKPLGGCPLGSGFDHVFTDEALFVDVGVPHFSFEGDNGGFEGEAFELELNFECSSLEGRTLGTCQIDDPVGIGLLVHDIVPKLIPEYCFSSSCNSLLILAFAIRYNQQIIMHTQSTHTLILATQLIIKGLKKYKKILKSINGTVSLVYRLSQEA